MKKILVSTTMTIILFLAVNICEAANPADRTVDPLDCAVRAADVELFGKVFGNPAAEPAIEIHHNWDWLDSTLMPAVAMLYDRLDGLGRTTPRYLRYIEKWGEYDPGTTHGPIDHGDRVCAGYTYMWLYERSGMTSDHLEKTDDMIEFIFTIRDLPQFQMGYTKYWMRFWNDDIHMVPPFLARRGRLAGSEGIDNGKDARDISMEYLRAYRDVLRDEETGLYWHDMTSIGDYMWGRGNGWAAAGMTHVHRELVRDPEYEKQAAWIRRLLVKMADTLKDNRNVFGTWNADVIDRETYNVPETSGSGFFVYMIAYMINEGYLPRDEYLPVVQKAWNFLKMSQRGDGELMRVQPVGRGPITDDFEMNTESYGVGAFVLAAIEMSRLEPGELAAGDSVECAAFETGDFERDGEKLVMDMERAAAGRDDSPGSPAGNIGAVVPGEKLPETIVENGRIVIDGVEEGTVGEIFIFYRP